MYVSLRISRVLKNRVPHFGVFSTILLPFFHIPSVPVDASHVRSPILKRVDLAGQDGVDVLPGVESSVTVAISGHDLTNSK